MVADDFVQVRRVLESVASNGSTQREPAECARLLVEHGFISGRPPAACTLTPDGSDLLDALRDARAWAAVERLAGEHGPPTLATVKAAVAARISGGFNA
ncbi:hypothetical protein H4CHR_01862 [Variovorax sp. PBS-H4]|uniref:hypothetical protein n=1 Tax=Variovorax sp. PBS-H4 TaxID=434008 RepID=UPI001316D8A9|nr:hypothetical protein [Variovorax sp. PBS-H4]VTU26775.1 hypothetical protein H4CHR_01862 [Variovorax sp. PBS-H4]